MRTIHLKKMRILNKVPTEPIGLPAGFAQPHIYTERAEASNKVSPSNMRAHPAFRSPQRHDIVFDKEKVLTGCTPKKVPEIKWSNIETV